MHFIYPTNPPSQITDTPHHTCLCSPHYRNILPCTASHQSTDPLHKACQSFSALGNSLQEKGLLCFFSREWHYRIYTKTIIPDHYYTGEFPKGGGREAVSLKVRTLFLHDIFVFSVRWVSLSLEIQRNFTMKHLYLLLSTQHDRPTKTKKEKDYQGSCVNKTVWHSLPFLHTFPNYAHIPHSPSNCGWLLKQLQKSKSLKDPAHTGTT